MSHLTHFWCHCLKCEEVWISSFWPEFGGLTAADESGEECPECGGEVEIDNEYTKGDLA